MTDLHRKQLSPLVNMWPQGRPGMIWSSEPAPAKPSSAWTWPRVACMGRLELESGRKRCAYGPQNAS